MPQLKHTMPAVAVLILLISSLNPVRAVFAAGQDARGAVVGTVKDSNGALIRNVAVAVESPGSGFKRTTTSNSLGEFRVDALPPGDYRLTASAPGFAQTVSPLAIPVGSTPSLSLVLKPAGASEVLTVKLQGSLT